jgi:hypothetical protein
MYRKVNKMMKESMKKRKSGKQEEGREEVGEGMVRREQEHATASVDMLRTRNHAFRVKSDVYLASGTEDGEEGGRGGARLSGARVGV